MIKLRLVDFVAEEESCICTIPTIDKRILKDSLFSLDGHPAWSQDYKKGSLQAAPNGKCQLFVVDLENIV